MGQRQRTNVGQLFVRTADTNEEFSAKVAAEESIQCRQLGLQLQSELQDEL